MRIQQNVPLISLMAFLFVLFTGFPFWQLSEFPDAPGALQALEPPLRRPGMTAPQISGDPRPFIASTSSDTSAFPAAATSSVSEDILPESEKSVLEKGHLFPSPQAGSPDSVGMDQMATFPTPEVIIQEVAPLESFATESQVFGAESVKLASTPAVISERIPSASATGAVNREAETAVSGTPLRSQRTKVQARLLDTPSQNASPTFGSDLPRSALSKSENAFHHQAEKISPGRKASEKVLPSIPEDTIPPEWDWFSAPLQYDVNRNGMVEIAAVSDGSWKGDKAGISTAPSVSVRKRKDQHMAPVSPAVKSESDTTECVASEVQGVNPLPGAPTRAANKSLFFRGADLDQKSASVFDEATVRMRNRRSQVLAEAERMNLILPSRNLLMLAPVSPSLKRVRRLLSDLMGQHAEKISRSGNPVALVAETKDSLSINLSASDVGATSSGPEVSPPVETFPRCHREDVNISSGKNLVDSAISLRRRTILERWGVQPE